MVKKIDWKIWIGIVISFVFMYLAFRKVDFGQMFLAFQKANLWLIIPGVFLLITSHWIRAWRWQFLIEPVHHIKTWPLFSALMIGYMGNTFLPAKIGELLRAFVLAKKYPVSTSALFASVVVERLLDVAALLMLMVLSIFTFPFPDWAKQSGYITLVVLMLLIALLVFMKISPLGFKVFSFVLNPFPQKFQQKMLVVLNSFFDGIAPLKRPWHYVLVFVQSTIIWGLYVYIFYISLIAFNFVETYSMPWQAPFVLLVITTISIMVPSSPGYVGTYHYLCQLALALFLVPESEALTFAFVIHGLNFLPQLFIGPIFLSMEGVSLRKIDKKELVD